MRVEALRQHVAVIVDHARTPSPDLALALRSVATSEYTAAVDTHEAVMAAARAAAKAAEFAEGSGAAAAAALANTGEQGRGAAILASVEHELKGALSLERGVLELNRANATLASTKHAAVQAAKRADIAQPPWLSGRNQLKALRSEARRLEAEAVALEKAANQQNLIRLRSKAEASEAKLVEVQAAASLSAARVVQLTSEAEHLRALPDDLCAMEFVKSKIARVSDWYASAQNRLADLRVDAKTSNQGAGIGRAKRAQPKAHDRDKAQKDIAYLSRRLSRARVELVLVEQWLSVSADARQTETELEGTVQSIANEGRDRVARLLSKAKER